MSTGQTVFVEERETEAQSVQSVDVVAQLFCFNKIICVGIVLDKNKLVTKSFG